MTSKNDPIMPAELWMFWVTTNEFSRWLVALDETSGDDDLYLATFAEESANRIAKEQTEDYFNDGGESVIPVRVRPAPGPATRAMIEAVNRELRDFPESDLIPVPREVLASFLAEWPDTATPLAPEQLKSSPWKCCICGDPVRISDDLTIWHVAGATYHDAEVSSEDRKILADGLRLTD